MNITAIQPAKFQVRKFHFELADSVPPTCIKFKGGEPESYSIQAEVGYLVPPCSAESTLCGILVSLGFHLKPAAVSSSLAERFKVIAMECEGFFVIPRTVPVTYVDRDFIVNCYTILFGMLRGFVHTATGSIQGGPLILPGVVMGDLVDSAPAVLTAIGELRAQLVPPDIEAADSSKSLAPKARGTRKSGAKR